MFFAYEEGTKGMEERGSLMEYDMYFSLTQCTEELSEALVGRDEFQSSGKRFLFYNYSGKVEKSKETPLQVLFQNLFY